MVPQKVGLVTFVLGQAENDARDMATRRPKPKNTRFWSKKVAEVAGCMSKVARGPHQAKKVAEVAGCMSKVARGPHQAKRDATLQIRQMSVFLGSPEEKQRVSRIGNRRKISASSQKLCQKSPEVRIKQKTSSKVARGPHQAKKLPRSRTS